MKEFTPNILCIVETQIDKVRVESLATSIGFDKGYAVSSVGRSRGIGLFWNNTINIDIAGYSDYHLDCEVCDPGFDPWRLSLVYGEAQTHLRHQTWDTMRNIASLSTLPWLCIGDFNEVLYSHEHDRVGNRSQAQMDAFRDALDTCGLSDICYNGIGWTFEKR